MKLKVKKLDKNAILPTRGSEEAAGWDLYALHDTVIEGDEAQFIRTGLAIQIPEGYFGAVYARSGLACKQGLRPANCVGVIDSDYRGELIVCARNDNPAVILTEHRLSESTVERVPAASQDANKFIASGERVAQLVIQKYEDIEIEEVDELDSTSRGEGGFGSTGSK